MFLCGVTRRVLALPIPQEFCVPPARIRRLLDKDVVVRTVFGSTVAPSVRVVFTFVISLLMILAFQISLAGDADAKKKKRRYKRVKVTKRYRGKPRYAAYVIDAKTGKVLHSQNANAKRYPASLTKMMTLYLVFEDLKSGRIKKRDRLVMTREGWRRPPSKLGLKVGQSISIEQGILSLVTKSANDVATAFGGKLSGTEAKFAKRMTRKARQLGNEAHYLQECKWSNR